LTKINGQVAQRGFFFFAGKFKAGEKVALVGERAVKSTLVNVLLVLYAAR